VLVETQPQTVNTVVVQQATADEGQQTTVIAPAQAAPVSRAAVMKAIANPPKPQAVAESVASQGEQPATQPLVKTNVQPGVVEVSRPAEENSQGVDNALPAELPEVTTDKRAVQATASPQSPRNMVGAGLIGLIALGMMLLVTALLAGLWFVRRRRS
jgi:cobalamin biosynthesis Mg chelatase CobN